MTHHSIARFLFLLSLSAMLSGVYLIGLGCCQIAHGASLDDYPEIGTLEHARCVDKGITRNPQVFTFGMSGVFNVGIGIMLVVAMIGAMGGLLNIKGVEKDDESFGLR